MRGQVVAAIARAWDEGCPVARQPEKIAPIALRRWCSSNWRGVQRSDAKGRIRDLAKGLIAHFESDPTLVGPLRRDYEYLAECIAEALKRRGRWSSPPRCGYRAPYGKLLGAQMRRCRVVASDSFVLAEAVVIVN